MTLRGATLIASGFHAPEHGAVEAFTEAAIEIDETGTIAAIHHPGSGEYSIPKDAVILPKGWVLLPGFVDMHVHAPQYPQLGTALDEPLENWLFRYTFPLEARYADLDFARRVYGQLVADLLSVGTTTAVYHATVHVPATCVLADICVEKGQRALVGKVAMDHPEGTPEYYRDADAAAAIAGTRAVIDHIRAHPGNGAKLVQPIITPRFIPSCTDEALSGLGALAHETGCRVQTHCSESDWEHQYVLDRHGMTDTESLSRFGLLPPHSVLAHANFMSDNDMDLLRDARGGVAHCPLSNIYFANSVFPLRAALDRGVAVGLGSDISGGPAGTIWETARMAIAASRHLESGTDPALPAADRSARGEARITFRDAFRLATASAGDALGLPVGSFLPGNKFDAMAIDPFHEMGGIRLFDEMTYDETLLERILYGAARPNIAKVWVDGALKSAR